MKNKAIITLVAIPSLIFRSLDVKPIIVIVVAQKSIVMLLIIFFNCIIDIFRIQSKKAILVLKS